MLLLLALLLLLPLLRVRHGGVRNVRQLPRESVVRVRRHPRWVQEQHVRCGIVLRVAMMQVMMGGLVVEPVWRWGGRRLRRVRLLGIVHG